MKMEDCQLLLNLTISFLFPFSGALGWEPSLGEGRKVLWFYGQFGGKLCLSQGPNLVHPCSAQASESVRRDVLKKGSGGYKKVVEAFGEGILQADGEVDRPKLGQFLFSDPSKHQVLNRLLAPYISGICREILRLWLKGSNGIVLDIPLLFEAKIDKWTKPTVVVWVDAKTQLRRLMARFSSNEEDARNRINAQMSLDFKRTKADIVIDNSGSLEDLEEQFKKVVYLVTRPLTWTEFWLSRQGALTALVCIMAGVVGAKLAYGRL